MPNDETAPAHNCPTQKSDLHRIRLTGPASVVAAAPLLLGFRPEHSAVLIFLGDASRDIRLTVRLDLPSAIDDDAKWVESLVATGRHASAGHAILVVIDDIAAAVAPGLPWERLVEAVAHELERHDLPLVDALLIGRDKWWSYLCDNERCCDPLGTSLAASEAWRVQAAFAYEGVAAAPSRSAIVDRLRRLDDEWAADVADSVAVLDVALDAEARDLDVEEVYDLLTLSTGPDAVLRHDPEVAGQALVGLRDVKIRDAVIVRLVAAIDRNGARAISHTLDGLCSLVRVAPDSCVAPVASVVAVLAWQSGDGALASCALDRALAIDPNYSLALLIDSMVRHGIPPQAVRSSLAALQIPA